MKKLNVAEATPRAAAEAAPIFQSVVAIEKGPGAMRKEIILTLEGLELRITERIYSDMMAQVIRQNRNPEQLALECAKKAVFCAHELVKVITAAASIDAAPDRSHP